MGPLQCIGSQFISLEVPITKKNKIKFLLHFTDCFVVKVLEFEDHVLYDKLLYGIQVCRTFPHFMSLTLSVKFKEGDNTNRDF